MIVTLLSDFGTADYYVGAMKGAVLAADPWARVVDITHDIPAHDVEAGAFTLAAAYEAFPKGTIHVAVVDPGVGSARRGVVVEAGGHLFVGPDNGLFGHVYEREDVRRAFELTDRNYFRAAVSATFHGRDVFGPVAGALSRGVTPASFGREVGDFIRLPRARPRRLPDGALEAAVIHVDRFGNLVTNLMPHDVATDDLAAGRVRLTVGPREVRRFRRFYAEAPDETPEPFAIWGSAGFLELSVNRASAAQALDAGRGQIIKVSPESGV
jgi:S-adenosylmethionine hydrolase